MSIFHSLAAYRLIFVLAIVNMVTVSLLFLSCRCFPGMRVGRKLMKYRLYQRFYRYHCYIWPLLWVSVVVHALFGIQALGWPR